MDSTYYLEKSKTDGETENLIFNHVQRLGSEPWRPVGRRQGLILKMFDIRNRYTFSRCCLCCNRSR